MAYFRARNNTNSEYSGYQTASAALRGKLLTVINHRSGYNIGLGNENYFLDARVLDHEIKLRMNISHSEAISNGLYDEVFETVEVFLSLVQRDLLMQVYEETLRDVTLAFISSGSVYDVNKKGQIDLHISEETAKNIDHTGKQLAATSDEAADFFWRAVNDLLTRKRGANDIVKDFAVAIEDYIKAISGKTDFAIALKELQTRGIIAPTQKGVLDKLYAYRGDAHGVAHSGNTPEPGEADAIWFLETLVAQVKMIETKLKSLNN